VESSRHESLEFPTGFCYPLSMSIARQIVLWLHILSAITWIGGMIFLSAALVPYARTLDPASRSRIIAGAGRRFRTVSWIAIALLFLTGFANLGFLGLTSQLGSYLTSPVGQPLLWKLILVALMILLSLVHDVIIGPRATQDPQNMSLRRASSWIGRVNLLLGLVVLYLALWI
jgi:putative copper resistance protein D